MGRYAATSSAVSSSRSSTDISFFCVVFNLFSSCREAHIRGPLVYLVLDVVRDVDTFAPITRIVEQFRVVVFFGVRSSEVILLLSALVLHSLADQFL